MKQNLGFLFVAALLFGLSVQDASAAVQSTGRNQMTVEVDPATCLESYTFCSQLGQPVAALGNHGPVLLMIQLIDGNGAPVTGLVTGDFTIRHKVSPQGSGPVKAPCAACFTDHGDGVYSLVVYRDPLTNPWLDGIYFTQLTVAVTATKSFNALVPIQIPTLAPFQTP